MCLNEAMQRHTLIGTLAVVALLIGAAWCALSPKELKMLTYDNSEYGFAFSLPTTWKGYSVVPDTWSGYASGERGDTLVEKGPLLLLRHPLWTKEKPRQDIPIMVFELHQWDALQQDAFHIGAAPIGPRELDRNSRYVFALPARYNFAFPEGYEEVETILSGDPLRAF